MRKLIITKAKKNNKEQGSITLFTLISLIFFLIIGIEIYINVSNNEVAQVSEIEKIKSEYQINKEQMDEKYEEVIDNVNQKVVITLKKVSDNSDYVSGTWTNDSVKVKIEYPEGTIEDDKIIYVNGKKVPYKEEMIIEETSTIKVIFNGKEQNIQINIDKTMPTLTITANKQSPTNASSITYTFKFSEDVTEFTQDDILVTNGTKGAFSGSGKTYTLVVTNSGSTTQTVKVDANKCTDAAGNGNTASNTVSITIDKAAPTVTITANKTSPTNASSITYTFTFNENVTGFTADDILVTNGTKGTFSGSGKTYTLVVQNSGTTTQKVKVNANVCTDIAGNGNTASNEISISIDRTPPSLYQHVSTGETGMVSVYGEDNESGIAYIEDSEGNKHTPKSKDNVKILVIENQKENNMQTSQGIMPYLLEQYKNVEGNASKTYDQIIQGGYDVIISYKTAWSTAQADLLNKLFAAGKSIITVGNDNTNAINIIKSNTSSSVGYTANRKVTNEITNKMGGSLTVGNDGMQNVQANDKAEVWYSFKSGNVEYDAIMYMENEKGGKWFHSQMALSGSALRGALNVITRLANINGVSEKVNSNGTYTYKIVDKAGNITTKQINVTGIDMTAPTVKVTANKSSPTNASSITYTFTFSKNVTGFTASDISVTNGSKGTFSGSGKTYTLVVTNSGSTTQSVKVNANVCTDTLGNGNKASNTVSITIDRTAPTVKITANKSSPTNANSITYTFTFSENVTGFAASDISVTNGSKGTFSGSGKTYTLVVNQSSSTTQTVKVNANVCTDGVGNKNTASNTVSIVIDRTAPTISIGTQLTNPSEVVSTYMNNNYTNTIKDTNGVLKYGAFKQQTFSILVTTKDTNKISSIQYKVSPNNVTANQTNFNNLGNVRLSGSASNKASGTQTTTFTGRKLANAGIHYIYVKAVDSLGNTSYGKIGLYVYTDLEKFIVLCYNNILGRAPEYNGFQMWIDKTIDVLNGGDPILDYTGTSDRKIKAIVSTLAGFYFSDEYNKSWWNSKPQDDLIRTFYWGALRRNPANSEITGWRGKTRDELFWGIATSTEAIQKFGQYSLNDS